MGLSSVRQQTWESSRWSAARASWSSTFSGVTSLLRKLSPKQRLKTPSRRPSGNRRLDNSVLHLLAIANEAKIPLSIVDFDRISSRVPIIADLKPEEDLSQPTFTRRAGLRSSRSGCLKQDCSGRSHHGHWKHSREEAAKARETPSQEVVRKLDAPLKPTAACHLEGNLAPEGCVIKVAGHNLQNFRGPARVFDKRRGGLRRVEQGAIKAGDVIVIRYEVRKVVPVCVRCWRLLPRSLVRAWAIQSLCAYGRTLSPVPRTAHGWTRRPRGCQWRPYRGYRRR